MITKYPEYGVGNAVSYRVGDCRAKRSGPTQKKNMKAKLNEKNYTTSPSPPSPTLGLRTDARGRILIDSQEAQNLPVETQLTIILFALAGRRYVASPGVFHDMHQRVVHLIDAEQGGVRAEFRSVYESAEAIAASQAHKDRLHERNAQQKCSFVFVGGLDESTTPAEIAELFDEWDVQHIHLGKSAGLIWAKAYLPPEQAEAACEYYENRDGVIRGRKIRITKSASSNSTKPPGPAGATEAS